MIETKDPFVGRTLDEKYCVEERLGAGGMGAVYRARHVLMDRPVAIKVLHQRLVEDEAARVSQPRSEAPRGRRRRQHPPRQADLHAERGLGDPRDPSADPDDV